MSKFCRAAKYLSKQHHLLSTGYGPSNVTPLTLQPLSTISSLGLLISHGNLMFVYLYPPFAAFLLGFSLPSNLNYEGVQYISLMFFREPFKYSHNFRGSSIPSTYILVLLYWGLWGTKYLRFFICSARTLWETLPCADQKTANREYSHSALSGATAISRSGLRVSWERVTQTERKFFKSCAEVQKTTADIRCA